MVTHNWTLSLGYSFNELQIIHVLYQLDIRQNGLKEEDSHLLDMSWNLSPDPSDSHTKYPIKRVI